MTVNSLHKDRFRIHSAVAKQSSSTQKQSSFDYQGTEISSATFPHCYIFVSSNLTLSKFFLAIWQLKSTVLQVSPAGVSTVTSYVLPMP